MLPLRDDNPTRTFPLVTILLILANGLVWLWELTLGSGDQLGRFFLHFGFVPGVLIGKVSPPPAPLVPYALSILSSMFVHGSWSHVLGNMLFLWIFGNNIEDRLGHARYLLFYIAGGVAAALVHLLSDPSSSIPTIGASGAIAAVMGAYLFLFPHAKIRTLVFVVFITSILLPAWLFLGIWFLIQLFQGTFAGNAEGVAVWAHIGGFLFGVVVAAVTARTARMRSDNYTT
jgi:membrane associated rhomboid family serine protease